MAESMKYLLPTIYLVKWEHPKKGHGALNYVIFLQILANFNKRNCIQIRQVGWHRIALLR
jgi:hypothetical protein